MFYDFKKKKKPVSKKKKLSILTRFFHSTPPLNFKPTKEGKEPTNKASVLITIIDFPPISSTHPNPNKI